MSAGAAFGHVFGGYPVVSNYVERIGNQSEYNVAVPCQNASHDYGDTMIFSR